MFCPLLPKKTSGWYLQNEETIFLNPTEWHQLQGVQQRTEWPGGQQHRVLSGFQTLRRRWTVGEKLPVVLTLGADSRPFCFWAV